jgi:response regulator of citrate/malate metabolism
MQRLAQARTQNAKAEVTPFAPTSARAQTSTSVQPDPAQTVQGLVQTKATQVDAEVAQVDADLASELIASGVTTQPVETVIAVLAASRDGASINAAANASGINYRTAQRIVEAAAKYQQRELAAVS